ncbi:MAG: peroxiredoxin-like family protein [Bacteroidota bacterium]
MKNLLLLLSMCIFFISCSQQSPEKEETTSQKKEETTPTKPEQAVQTDLTKYGIAATSTIPEGLQIGTEAPMFVKKAHTGEDFNLETMLADGPVVIQFYRGQWCPYCTRNMANFQDSLQMITDKGATVIAVGPESMENALMAVEKSKASYPLIPDYNLEILDAYKVTFTVTDDYTEKVKNYASHDLADNGSGVSKLPVPATYVIGQDKKVKYVQFDPDYSNRASVQEILSYL